MQIVDDHTIIFEHSNRLMTIEAAKELANNSRDLYRQAVIGYLKPNVDFKKPAKFPNLQSVLQAGRLTDATFYYQLEWGDDGIVCWLSVGSKLLCFATYNRDNNAAIYQRFAQLPDSTTAFVDPQTMAIFLLDEDVLAAANLPDQREDYLEHQRQAPISQYFFSNLPANRPLSNPKLEGTAVDIPIDNYYQNLLEKLDPQEVFECCSQDAAFRLASVSDQSTDFSDAVSPVSDNVRLSLFTGINYGDSQDIVLNDDDSQVQVHNLDGRGFNLRALRFVLTSGQHNRIFYLTDQGQPFLMGETHSASESRADLAPTAVDLMSEFLGDGRNHWTCLYFPQQTWTGRSDGQQKIEFKDYIFFFRH